MKHEHHLELKGRMRAKRVTIDTIARKTKACPSAVTHHLTRKTAWPYDMILDICELCEIDLSEIPLYFERSKAK